MDIERLKKITTTANEAVKDLDPELKKIAFDNILNRLLDESCGTLPSKKTKPAREAKPRPKTVSKKTSEPSELDSITTKILTSINTTKYPVMFKLNKTLDRSLYLLKIVRDDLQIDGLVPSQIGKVLTEKFRKKTTGNAVSMALMDALKYVDRRPVTIQGGSGYTYHIMHDGEEYLKPIIEKVNEE